MNNQSEDRVLGTVGIYLRGEYDSSVKYEYMNQVAYQGSSYTCIKEEGCTGIDPTNSDYWICSAKKGEKGEKGDTGDVGPIGPKPVNGTDYNTNAEREEFKNAVVADSKADLEKYITEKETQLDNYTKNKKTNLDDYVTDTVKPTIDTYVTDTTKKDIDAYEKEKEKVLDTYTDTKKTEIDNYVTNTSKPALDQYEKDKEAELETAKNAAINEYDAHAESVLTETNDLFNALNTEKASGTEPYIEDAKPCRVINVGISGMYKQETTTGAQLIDYKIIESCSGNTKYTFTNKILEITVTNNANSNIAYNITNAIKNNPGKTLYFNCKSYKFNEGISPKVQLLIKKDNNITYNTIFDSSGEKKPYNIPADTSDITSASIRFVTNNTNTVASTKISVTEPIISFVPNAKYEPYTGGNPSPNPDYPQEIKQVESVVLNACNKNFLNLGTQLNGYANESYKYFNGDDNAIGFYFKTEQLPDNIYISSKNGNRTAVSYYNEIPYKTLPYLERDFSNSKDRTIKVNKNYKYIHIQFSIGITQVTEMQIEGGTTKTDYKLSQAKAINIDLKGNKLCAVSDTIKGKLLIDRNGNVALQKNVSLITLKKDNIVSRTVLSNGDILYRTTRSIINSNKIFVLCNYYIGIPNISSRADGTIYCNTSNSNSIDIVDNSASITTVDKYKTFVENNQIEVYYSLATPEIIDLGQLPELPKTFEGINNIWAETNLGNTEIEIEYVQDVKKLLEQQDARLDNIEALLSTTETSALLLDNMQTDLESEVK